MKIGGNTFNRPIHCVAVGRTFFVCKETDSEPLGELVGIHAKLRIPLLHAQFRPYRRKRKWEFMKIYKDVA